ncbi:MAG: hypothetical protein M3Q12_01110 [Pseudomonadota bacterium]|nr:hypothetical protein [Pseudomonadota bacterium]
MSDDSLFTYALSDDKSKLKIELRVGVREFSAAEVSKLAIFFANLRAEMAPAVTDNYLEDKVHIPCDRYEVVQHPETGTAQVHLRIPGFGWPFIEFSNAESVLVSEVLNPQAPPDGADKH